MTSFTIFKALEPSNVSAQPVRRILVGESVSPDRASVLAKWSPDGRRLVFVSNRDGGFELYVMTAMADAVRKVER